ELVAHREAVDPLHLGAQHDEIGWIRGGGGETGRPVDGDPHPKSALGELRAQLRGEVLVLIDDEDLRHGPAPASRGGDAESRGELAGVSRSSQAGARSTTASASISRSARAACCT